MKKILNGERDRIMNEEEYIRSREEYRALFPTKEMYDEFLLYSKMTKEERDIYSNEQVKRLNTMSKDEYEKYQKDLVDGLERFVNFAKKEIPELAFQQRMYRASKSNIQLSKEEICKKIEQVVLGA